MSQGRARIFWIAEVLLQISALVAFEALIPLQLKPAHVVGAYLVQVTLWAVIKDDAGGSRMASLRKLLFTYTSRRIGHCWNVGKILRSRGLMRKLRHCHL